MLLYDTLGSTNAEALKLAREGETRAAWIVAERQTAGRGRRSRTWVSQPGNLFATFLSPQPGHRRIGRSCRSSQRLPCMMPWLGIDEELKRRVAIHGRNDLLLDRKKFAGILVEGEGGEEEGAVAIGIGVDCVCIRRDRLSGHQPWRCRHCDFARNAHRASLSQDGRAPGAVERGEGFSTVRADWMARAAGIGERMGVRLPDRELWGVFEALDEAGHLLLRLPDGRLETITAADMMMLR